MSEITENEMLEALNRSGYLLESEVVKIFTQQGYFVEANQVVLDPLTGKSREIDIVATIGEYLHEEAIHIGISLVIEVKNNTSPLVLLTESHNSALDINVKTASTVYDSTPFFWEGFHELLNNKKDVLFSQYCCFEKKNGKDKELMALHSDIVYSGLTKITQYSEENIEQVRQYFKEGTTSIKSEIVYLPVLLINDDLYEFRLANKGDGYLKRVERSKLQFNYYYKQEPKSSLIYVVTKKGLPGFIRTMKRNKQKVMELIKRAIKNDTK